MLWGAYFANMLVLLVKSPVLANYLMTAENNAA